MSNRRLAPVLALAGLLLAGASWGAPQTAMAQSAASATGLPRDVFPETRNRLPALSRDRLDERGKRTYDAAMAASGTAQAVALIRLHMTGVDVRWSSPLGRRLVELVILTTARETDQPYEWSVHEMEAVGWGLSPRTIDVVRNRKPLTGLDPKEAILIELTRDVVARHRLSSETYARALNILGESNLADIASLIGMYVSTAATLTAFNAQMPAQMVQWLPLPFPEPTDIHPDSRMRLPLAKAPPLGNQSLYAREIAPTGTGPTQVRAHAGGAKSLEEHVGQRLLALAALVTAREHDQQYQWTVTEPGARAAGLEPAIIEVVRDRKPATGLGEKEAAIVEFGRELFGKNVVSAATYARALKIFGETDLVDLVSYMAQQSSNASILTVFDQHLPADQRPLLAMR